MAAGRLLARPISLGPLRFQPCCFVTWSKYEHGRCHIVLQDTGTRHLTGLVLVADLLEGSVDQDTTQVCPVGYLDAGRKHFTPR
jgi:hypothetical protein